MVSQTLRKKKLYAKLQKYELWVDSIINSSWTHHLQWSSILSIGLAASLGYGMASELVRRSTSSSDENVAPSLMLTEGNVKRLVSKLTHMRGAALKLGQFMSIQGLYDMYMRDILPCLSFYVRKTAMFFH